MRKMKIKQILWLTGLIVLAACSKEASINGNNNDNVQTNAIEIENITITEEPFLPENPKKETRVTKAPQIVDLGDGLMAEVSLAEDVQEEAPAQTRAAIADGHYTIYATKYVAGRMPGVSGPIVGTLSGTVQGGKFVRDAGSRLRLSPDTYTFVCINDAVSKEVHSYHGDVFALTNDQDNPMMGVNTMAISGPGVEIPFAMKHRETARVRFQLTSYTAEGHNVTGTLTLNNIATKSFFDMEGRLFGGLGTSFTSNTYTFAESPVTSSAYTQEVKHTTGYRYFISGSTGANAQLTLQSGTIYGKSLAGKSFPLTAIATLQENKSYTCNIKFRTIYCLFEDGTIGSLGDKGTRTPIGVVVREKTATTPGMAVALHNAGNVIWGQSIKATKQYLSFDSPSDFTSLSDYLSNGYTGYELTWKAETSTDAKIKANEPTLYPAFYAAAHYTSSPAPTGANIGKWFYPAVRDWVDLGRYFKGTANQNNGISLDGINLAPLIQLLSDLGADPITGQYYTSTERGDDRGWRVYVFDDTNLNIKSYGYKYQQHPVRPFVYF